mgnify:CR=1 FL=1
MAGIKPKHHHSDRDRIFTPEDVAKECIKKIPSSVGDSWCDCCLGEGVFYNNFPTDNKHWYEIDKGRDFLTSSEKYDWIVTNIPFSKPKEFIAKMSDNCNKGFGILCLANSMTATRLEQLKKKGLYLNSVTILYIKDWGFGYRTDFYVFTRQEIDNLKVIISERTESKTLPNGNSANAEEHNIRLEVPQQVAPPKFEPTVQTSLNSNIKRNFSFGSLAGRYSK